MKEVEGKVAFITGGSSGIGLGIARAFTNVGMKVVIGYRTREHLSEAMQFLKDAADRVHAIEVDVTNRLAIARAATEIANVFDKLHVLVCNAGVDLRGSFSSTTYDDWDWLMDVNLNGAFNSIHEFLPHIRSHGEGGHVIATASMLGLISARGAQPAYVASKFALVGLMESLRAELASTNIGVSVFCPGGITSRIMEASRNRPNNLADTCSKLDFSSIAREKGLRDELSMDPFEAGELVLRGMQDNNLYILTHSEFEQAIRDRNEALLLSVPRHLRATDSREAMARSMCKNSIYIAERDRKLGRQSDA